MTVSRAHADAHREAGIETGTASAFRPRDGAKAWLVEDGSVDVFLVPSRDGETVGARHHLLRVSEGSALFGVDRSGSPSMELLASPTPGARLSEASREQLRHAAVGGEKERAVGLVDAWIRDLSKAVAGDVLPKVFATLEPGQEAVCEQPRSLLPRSGVVWVTLAEGAARFLGDAEIPLVIGRPFPVAASAWIDAEQNSRLLVTDTATSFQEASLWVGFDAYMAAVLDRAVRNVGQATKKEAARLARRGRSDQNRLDLALRLLSSPLEREALVHETGDDPWLLACRAVGRVAGIDFKPHPDRQRVSLRDPVSAIAAASRVRTRTVALKGDWWHQDVGPMVARREADSAPVALLPVSPRRYELYDPVTRSRTPVDATVAAKLDPFAWCFYRPFPARALRAVDLVQFGLDGCGRDLATVLMMGAGVGLLGMAVPIVTGIVFDSIIPGADRNQLRVVTLLLMVAAVCGSVFQVVQSFALRRLEAKMDASLQAGVWDRLLSLPVPFFRDYSAGDLAMRSLGISAMRRLVTDSVTSSLLSGASSVFGFFLLFYYSWRLALVATGLTALTVLAATLTGYFQVRYNRESMAVGGRLSGMLLQLVNGVSKLRVSATENRAFAAWAREFSRKKAIAFKTRTLSIAFAVFSSMIPVLSAAAIFWASSRLLDQSGTALSTGSFLAFLVTFVQFQFSALALSAAVVTLLSVVPLYERALPILTALPETHHAMTDPGELAGNIEVKHANFRYRPDAPLVVRDVSIKIPAGRFVAIVGPSGSGKSTLFRMLMGFETPESGAIYFDDQDQAHLDVQAMRQQVGVVLQSGRLLTDSLFKNIVGNARLTMEDAWAAAAMAGLEKDIQAMPMGMHTVVSEGGGGLSGGQRQRVMIARAIVKKPRILLFDEATSALDNETQAIVSQSLESLQATRIVIAHRLSTIVHADYIYVMEKGAVVQEGTYQELMQQDGPFADLAKRQTA
jgi:NHLM bacteriocin system ABC transporter ATP-binding protein